MQEPGLYLRNGSLFIRAKKNNLGAFAAPIVHKHHGHHADGEGAGDNDVGNDGNDDDEDGDDDDGEDGDNGFAALSLLSGDTVRWLNKRKVVKGPRAHMYRYHTTLANALPYRPVFSGLDTAGEGDIELTDIEEVIRKVRCPGTVFTCSSLLVRSRPRALSSLLSFSLFLCRSCAHPGQGSSRSSTTPKPSYRFETPSFSSHPTLCPPDDFTSHHHLSSPLSLPPLSSPRRRSSSARWTRTAAAPWTSESLPSVRSYVCALRLQRARISKTLLYSRIIRPASPHLSLPLLSPSYMSPTCYQA